MPWIVSWGTIGRGFEFYGPFPDDQAALEFVEKVLDQESEKHAGVIELIDSAEVNYRRGPVS